MPFYDWICPNNHKELDVWYSAQQVPEHRPCAQCSAPAVQLFAGSRNGLHTSHSSMYGKYNPGLGQVVESYGHKQQLLKQYDLVESSDRTHGSRCYMPDEYSGIKQKDEQPRRATEQSLAQASWGGIPSRVDL